MNCSFSDQELILHLLKGLSNQISPKFERCTGISSTRYELLFQLYRTEEISQSTLQKAINIDSAAITRHLKLLEAEGMVSRRRNPSDNRVTFVRLTEEGRSHLIGFKKEQVSFVNQMLHDFKKKELEALTDMLNRMKKNIVDY